MKKKLTKKSIGRRKNPSVVTYGDIILLSEYLQMEDFSDNFESREANRIEDVIHHAIYAYLLEVPLDRNIEETIKFQLEVQKRKLSFHVLSLALEKKVIKELGLFRFFNEREFDSFISREIRDLKSTKFYNEFINSQKGKFFIDKFSKRIAYDLYELIQRLRRENK